MTQRFKLGRLPKQRPEGLKALHEYGTLPPAPQSFGIAAEEAFAWGMLGNDEFGDCEFAGFVHGNEAVTLLEGKTPAPIADSDVVEAYLAYTGGQDTGCVTSQVLSVLFKEGILGVNVDAYAPIEGGIPELLEAIAAFGAVCLGVNLPMSAQEQFPSREWRVVDPDGGIEGGHCIYAVGFDQDAQTVTVVTWGALVIVTFGWLDKYLDEAWAVLFEPVKAAGALDGIDFDDLLADLEGLPEAIAEAA